MHVYILIWLIFLSVSFSLSHPRFFFFFFFLNISYLFQNESLSLSFLFKGKSTMIIRRTREREKQKKIAHEIVFQSIYALHMSDYAPACLTILTFNGWQWQRIDRSIERISHHENIESTLSFFFSPKKENRYICKDNIFLSFFLLSILVKELMVSHVRDSSLTYIYIYYIPTHTRMYAPYNDGFVRKNMRFFYESYSPLARRFFGGIDCWLSKIWAACSSVSIFIIDIYIYI
mgnify:CR=1 FL=1